MPSSSSPADPGHRVAATADLVGDVAAAVVPSTRSEADGIVSLLCRQDVDALCAKHGIPKEFTAYLAGDLRASSIPPEGAVCVYEQALEAGMDVPLHGFVCEVLAHFGLAPTQLTPNSWRIMARFLVLCDVVGVPPSLRIFRHFFFLSVVNQKNRGCWYFFRSRDASSGLRFSGFPHYIQDWKQGFFFLSSPAAWPCPVEWGEPLESSLVKPVLTDEEDKWARKLRRASRGATIDPTTHVRDKPSAAMRVSVSPSPPTPTVTPSARTTDSSIEMDPVVYGMMKAMLAEKAAAQDSASAKKGKTVRVSEATESSPLCGRKRSLGESNGEEGPSVVVNSPAGSHGCSMPAPKAASNTASPSGYPLDVEKRLLARERDAAALREQLAEVKAELAALKRAEAEREKANIELVSAKRTVEAEYGKVRAELAAVKQVAKAAEQESADARMAAVQQLLSSEEGVVERAKYALEGYERWKASASTARRT